MTSLTSEPRAKLKRPLAIMVVVILAVGIVAGVYFSLSSNGLRIGLNKTLVRIQRGTSQTVQISLTGLNSPAETVLLSTSSLPSNVTAKFSNPSPQLVANGNDVSNLTITAGIHAYAQNSTLTITAATAGPTRQASLLITVIGNTYDYNMEGSYSSGWSITTINATQGDILDLHLTSQDGLTHAWFADYNGNMTPDAGEPLSPNFNSPTVPVAFGFTITQTGAFNYYCKFHPNMVGKLHLATP